MFSGLLTLTILRAAFHLLARVCIYIFSMLCLSDRDVHDVGGTHLCLADVCFAGPQVVHQQLFSTCTLQWLCSLVRLQVLEGLASIVGRHVSADLPAPRQLGGAC
jgi:hypothetical protein